MFKCDYILNDECQLYSKKCDGASCQVNGQCHSCRYKFIGYGENPCNTCPNLKGTDISKASGTH